MKAPRNQIAKLIARRSLAGKLTAAHIKQLAAYILEEGRSAELASILRDVQAVWAREGYVEVIATSAHTLTPAVNKDIEREARRLYPDAKKITITPHLDPNAIGGVKLSIVDHQLDLTTRSKLQQFKMLAVHGKDYA